MLKIQNRAEKDSIRRNQVVQAARSENERAAERVREAYDYNNVKLSIEENMLRDLTKPSDVMRKAAAVESLRHILRDREKKVQERLQKRDQSIKKVSKEEAYRLINFANNLNLKLHHTSS